MSGVLTEEVEPGSRWSFKDGKPGGGLIILPDPSPDRKWFVITFISLACVLLELSFDSSSSSVP